MKLSASPLDFILINQSGRQQSGYAGLFGAIQIIVDDIGMVCYLKRDIKIVSEIRRAHVPAIEK
jgi:hypothetical protein